MRGSGPDAGDALLDADVVIPAVAEVVLVAELAHRIGGLPDGEGLLLPRRPPLDLLDVDVEDTVDVEPVQVVVEPAHRGLDDAVQLAQGERVGNNYAPPNRRMRVAQRDRQLHCPLGPAAPRFGLRHRLRRHGLREHIRSDQGCAGHVGAENVIRACQAAASSSRWTLG